MSNENLSVIGAIEALEYIASMGSEDAKLCVQVHAPGSLGGTPAVAVTGFHVGFDWDRGKVLVSTDPFVVDITREEVAAISESVRKGQSWHAYQVYKDLRAKIAALEAELKALKSSWVS